MMFQVDLVKELLVLVLEIGLTDSAGQEQV
jgi:hypothetical protein